jgi:signal transduction histidine kinase
VPTTDTSPTKTENTEPRHYRLGVQVLFGLAMLAAIVALCSALVVRQLERDYLMSLKAAESEKTFELIVSASLENIISEDLPRLETTIRQVVARDPDLFRVEMINERGVVLYSWHRDSQAKHTHFFEWLEHGHDILHFTKAVVFEGETFGTVVAEWDTTRTDLEISRHTYLIAMAVVAICVLLGVFAYMVVNGVAVMPINQISRRVLRLKDGSFEARTQLPAFASAEMRELDRSVDVLSNFLILERQRTAELEAAKEAAEEASRAKSAFLAVISHELRTPLHAINGFSEILDNQIHGALGDTRYKEYAGHIVSSGQHLLSLINDLLDMSKIEAGEASLQFEEFDPGELISEALKLVQHPIAPGQAQVLVEAAPGLPRLRADKRRIRQILLNLISNAIKFTPCDGRITVSASWAPTSGMTIQVQDTGIGIAGENLDLVLEPFRQVEDPLSRAHEGSGLGLPLARALIELHGGEIRIESQPSIGTTVTVALPPELVVESAHGSGGCAAASAHKAASNGT